MAEENSGTTDDEGTFLALLLRIQPATTYQIAKVYDSSPVSNFGTSKGKLYPLVRRLKARGLVSTRTISGDRRGTEQLLCTRKGETAVRSWIKQIRPGHVLLEDPLRTKVQSFDLLSREERIEWIVEAKSLMMAKLAELEEYRQQVDVPFIDIVHDNAIASIRSRMDWLDRLLRGVVKGEKAKPASGSGGAKAARS
jgi:DNA-binding PadR family transcriptional regulator